MNCCSEFFFKLGIGRLATTEYRVLPSIRYSAKPSNRTEYRFSPTFLSILSYSVFCQPPILLLLLVLLLQGCHSLNSPSQPFPLLYHFQNCCFFLYVPLVLLFLYLSKPPVISK